MTDERAVFACPRSEVLIAPDKHPDPHIFNSIGQAWTLLPDRFFLFFFNDTATTEIYTLSLHDALPILGNLFTSSLEHPEVVFTIRPFTEPDMPESGLDQKRRSEEHTSELQSRPHLVCRRLLDRKTST